jgi:hypothetical protein
VVGDRVIILIAQEDSGTTMALFVNWQCRANVLVSIPDGQPLYAVVDIIGNCRGVKFEGFPRVGTALQPPDWLDIEAECPPRIDSPDCPLCPGEVLWLESVEEDALDAEPFVWLNDVDVLVDLGTDDKSAFALIAEFMEDVHSLETAMLDRNSWDPFIAKMIATKGPARNYLMEYSFQAAGMFDFGYFAQWRRRVQHGDAVMYMERAAEAEGVKGDEMGSNFVMGLIVRPLDKEDHADGTRLFAYIELGSPGLWSALGRQSVKRLVPVWLDAFRHAVRVQFEQQHLERGGNLEPFEALGVARIPIVAAEVERLKKWQETVGDRPWEKVKSGSDWTLWHYASKTGDGKAQPLIVMLDCDQRADARTVAGRLLQNGQVPRVDLQLECVWSRRGRKESSSA